MMDHFTVLHIQMLLHYHAIAEPYSVHNPEHANSQAVQQYRAQLLKWGYLLEANNSPSGYCPTMAGERYIKRIKEMA